MSDSEWIVSNAGVRLPRLLYGTAWKKDDTAGLVELALAQGFRGIDTACQPKHYNEGGVGEGLAAAFRTGLQRDALYLQTKFTSLSGQDPARVPYDAQAPLARQVAQSFAVSLRNLRVEQIDGLILHSPLPQMRQTLEAWRAMEALVDAGGVRQIGISNCYALDVLRGLHDAARIKPAVVQNRFYADSGYDRDLRRYCREQGIVYQSFWTLTANPHLLASGPIRTAATQHGRTPAQILFRYLRQQGVVPLTGTRDPAHMREDLAVFDFSLAEAECTAITALL
jgi:diketogulonate reductase-like aldo/keto reductase